MPCRFCIWQYGAGVVAAPCCPVPRYLACPDLTLIAGIGSGRWTLLAIVAGLLCRAGRFR